MKQKAAHLIVRYRIVLMTLWLILAVAAASTLGRVRVNYDLTSYLREDTDTMRALALMRGEFAPTSAMSVVLIDADADFAAAETAYFAAQPGVMSASHDPERDLRRQDGHTYRLISLIMTEEAENAVLDDAQAHLQDIPHLLSGGAKDARDLKDSINQEMPLVMLVSCLIVLVVLLLMTRAFIEPALFFLVIALSILLNMGTNWIFPSISFITFAVAAILQLALAMDYSIMLMNAFDRLRGGGLPAAQAMEQALCEAFMPVASSALTTVAGMLALVFMRFTIGFDIGVVLAKGILFSMLTVFLFMPGLLVLAAPLLDKTAHRALPLSGKGIVRASHALHSALPAALIVLILCGTLLQSGNVYTYTVRDMSDDARQVSRLFGQSNQIVLIFPRDDSDEGVARQRELITRVSALTVEGRPVVQQAMAMVTTGESALAYYDAASAAALLGRGEGEVQALFSLMGIQTPIRGDQLIARMAAAAHRLAFLLPDGALEQLDQAQALLSKADAAFNGPAYSRALLALDLPMTSPHVHETVRAIKAAEQAVYGDSAGLAGTLVAIDDIATSFSADMKRVSLTTIGLVFLIILVSFRSLVVPTLLVCVIQGAIWINMGFSSRLDGSIFFMCYLICIALQMGATIDYGILLTSHYRALRPALDKREAAAQAVSLSLQTIFTSGMALIVAGFAVGVISSVFYISSIGTMLARGAIVSVALVLFLLPRLLQWLDRWIGAGA